MTARRLLLATLLCASLPVLAEEAPPSGATAGPAVDDLDRAQRIERAAAALQRGELKRAQEELAPLVAATGDEVPAEARLLYAVTLFRLGRNEEARARFAPLAGHSNPKIAQTARTFLGLLALDDGAVDEGRRQLQSIQRLAPSLGAERLVERAAGKRLRLLLLVQPGFDSNVALQANLSQPLGVASTADGNLLFLAWLSARPLRAVQWFVETSASYRLQFTQRSFDYFQHLASTRYAYLGANDRFSASLGFATHLLGGELLLYGPQASLRYQRRLVRQLYLALDYAYWYRRYPSTDYAFLSGHDNAGGIELGWGMPEQRWLVALGYQVDWQQVNDSAFRFVNHSATLRARLRHRFFEGALQGRAGASVYLEGRRDLQLQLDASAAFDVRRELAIVVSVGVLRNESSLADFSYWKITAGLGLVVSWAGL